MVKVIIAILNQHLLDSHFISLSKGIRHFLKNSELQIRNDKKSADNYC